MGFQPGGTDGAGTPYPNDPLYGFRITSGGNGRIYGPYMKVDATNYVAASSTDQYFTDPLGQRILYFRANRYTASTAPTLYFGSATTGIFTTSDNPTATFGDPSDTGVGPSPLPNSVAFRQIIGSASSATSNNTISASDSPINQQTYLLVSPGINGSAGTSWYNGDGTKNGLYNSVVNSN